MLQSGLSRLEKREYEDGTQAPKPILKDRTQTRHSKGCNSFLNSDPPPLQSSPLSLGYKVNPNLISHVAQFPTSERPGDIRSRSLPRSSFHSLSYNGVGGTAAAAAEQGEGSRVFLGQMIGGVREQTRKSSLKESQRDSQLVRSPPGSRR